MVEISFKLNIGNFHLWHKQMNPIYIRLRNNIFVLTRKSVAFIYNTVKSLRLCKGIQNLAYLKPMVICRAADFSFYLHSDFFKSIKTNFTRKVVLIMNSTLDEE